jgi:hypothetical protein
MTTMLEKKIRQFPKTEDRAWPRINCEIDAELIVAGERWPCKIKDLGEMSFGIISSLKLHKGDIVEISDPRTKVQAVWAENGRAGLNVFNHLERELSFAAEVTW